MNQNTNHPPIKSGDWIKIGNRECVVCEVYSGTKGPLAGDCEVVFNELKPANLNANWVGDKWEFIKTGDYGGYAENYPRLRKYVEILKRGRWYSGY